MSWTNSPKIRKSFLITLEDESQKESERTKVPGNEERGSGQSDKYPVNTVTRRVKCGGLFY